MADKAVPPRSLGPYGLIKGEAHHYAYLSAAIVLGSICLVSTVVFFILAKSHNDLKQRGRYLVFWNGLSATGVVTVYLMLNSFAGEFPCFVLLWTSYLCIVPWLLTYLARGWRLVYIYNQQVDFGRTNIIIQRNSTIDSNDLFHESITASLGAGLGSGMEMRIGMGEAPVSNFRTTGRDDLGIAQSGPDHRQNPDQIRGGLPVAGSIPGPGIQIGGKDEAVINEQGYTTNTTNTNANNNSQAKSELDGSKSAPSTISTTEQGPVIANITTTTITPPHSIATAPRIPSNNNISARAIFSPPGIAIFPESNGVVLSSTNAQENWEALAPTSVGLSHDIREMIGRSQPITFDPMPTEEKHRWSRYLPFNKVTDSRLTVFLLGCMIFPFALCLGMQFVKPSPVQIGPISYKCGEGPVFLPIYAIMLAFLAVGCPILSWKLWWIKDGFGIRNELLITMIIGLPGFALYFLSPFYLKHLDAGPWNHVNWLTLTIFLAHVNSVVLPLIQFFMRQRPKKRTSSVRSGSSRFANIIRWDLPKSFPRTPTMEVTSDASSFHFHSRSSSQFVPANQHGPEQCDPSVCDRHSVAQLSIDSKVPVDYHGEDAPYVLVNYSTQTGHRLRGIKGFWAKYGKDAEGNIIPLSQMNPRAFEYALQDTEMLNELVKFSITVFSAENTKFLQEYEGLRKQVREYYKLAGQRNFRDKKPIVRVSDMTGSNLSDNAVEAIPGSTPGSKPYKKKASLLGSLTSSLHSKRSVHGSIAGGDGDDASWLSNRIGSVPDAGESNVECDGDPGPSMSVQQYALHPVQSFGKNRQDPKGNLWKLSLQSSLRNSSPAFASPYGPLHEEEDGDGPPDTRRTRSTPSPLSPPRTSMERRHQQKASLDGRTCHNEVRMSAIPDMSESKHGSGGDDSERSSFSWYGRGNNGSTLDYRDPTPGEVSSYPDTASDANQGQSEYFGDDSYSVVEDHRGGNYGIHEVLDGPSPTSSGLHSAPGASEHSHPTISIDATSSSAPYSETASRSPFGPRHRPSHSIGSIPLSAFTSDQVRDNALTSIGQQKQPSRLAHPVSHGLYHSSSSSISATFTPRLPSQPQPLSPLRPGISRTTSARSIQTVEEARQLSNSLLSSASSTPTGHLNLLPAQPQSQDQQQQHQVTETQSTPQAQLSVGLSLEEQKKRSTESCRPQSATQPQTLHQHSMSGSELRGSCPTAPSTNRRTPVPRALLPAYWEITHTFIMPHATLQLNLDEEHVAYIKQLFMDSECYLEMYEPIIKEVQELVYSNVWPRFVQSLQRRPQGLPGKFKRKWRSFCGTGSAEGQDCEDIYMGYSSGGKGGWQSNVSRTDQMGGSTSQDHLQQHQSDIQERGFSQAPPQASYVHQQFGYLTRGGEEGGRGGEGGRRNEKDDIEMDVVRFGVMQDLDMSVLQHIVVDPK
ncbi:hypothetical protein BC939DRAFT_502770 [Gamsiella multidivaricata]|uniref:uncharacterized protein n=1 Tax=Gamsiella multidivaricata TaxID=101098 RepID=UPI00221F8474|nr:uncharacterized protein BC939DRAFT_502770 [Gamsiella multidivaricata]KAG0367370.1 hypothetical protein BGZ54_003970 [Gamsiella multidivaricata]KAI7824345.1 hypothetical protein BC939DRAFT_502770 [Gamsiella multidivaricata]